MRWFKRFAVTILGVGLLGVGIALMVLPGPGILLIVAALAVLATEYVWAQRLLRRARVQATQAQQAAVASSWRTTGTVAFAIGMIGVGTAMVLVDDVRWPVADDLADRLWGPVPGTVVAVMGVVVIVTTYLTIRSASGESSTYMPRDDEPDRVR